MSLAELIPSAVKASILLSVFALGSSASFDDLLYLVRRPGLLLRSLLAMNVIMLVFAVAVISLIELPPAARIAIVALAVSPVPPLLPRKLTKVGGSASYGLSLVAMAGLLAIVLVPVSLEILGRYFGRDLRVPGSSVAPVVIVMFILPLALGMIVRRVAPGFPERFSRAISIAATVLLAVAVLPILFIALPPLWDMTDTQLVLALAVFSLLGLAVGHALGGPDPDDRTVLALATTVRHPGIALTVAGITFPDQKAVLLVVLAHLIVGAVVSIPYRNWRKHAHAAHAVT